MVLGKNISMKKFYPESWSYDEEGSLQLQLLDMSCLFFSLKDSYIFHPNNSFLAGHGIVSYEVLRPNRCVKCGESQA